MSIIRISSTKPWCFSFCVVTINVKVSCLTFDGWEWPFSRHNIARAVLLGQQNIFMSPVLNRKKCKGRSEFFFILFKKKWCWPLLTGSVRKPETWIIFSGLFGGSIRHWYEARGYEAEALLDHEAEAEALTFWNHEAEAKAEAFVFFKPRSWSRSLGPIFYLRTPSKDAKLHVHLPSYLR